MKIALYPGSFNPFTEGHKSIVERGLKIFDKIVIAIGINPEKEIPEDSRLEDIRSLYEEDSRVEVIEYSELTFELAKKLEVTAILRGVRNTIDFEYEKTLATINRLYGDGIETIFLPCLPELEHISSTLMRELKRHNPYT